MAASTWKTTGLFAFAEELALTYSVRTVQVPLSRRQGDIAHVVRTLPAPKMYLDFITRLQPAFLAYGLAFSAAFLSCRPVFPKLICGIFRSLFGALSCACVRCLFTLDKGLDRSFSASHVLGQNGTPSLLLFFLLYPSRLMLCFPAPSHSWTE